MNDWTDKCSKCKYAHCPTPDACYCAMEREAHRDVQNAMRMLTFVVLYVVAIVLVIGLALLL